MGRSRSIDTSHKQHVDPMEHYNIQNIQEREQLFTKTCIECGKPFPTKIKLSVHCGTCTSVANVLYVHYLQISQRWGINPAKPNGIVERVFNQQVKPFKRLTNVV